MSVWGASTGFRTPQNLGCTSAVSQFVGLLVTLVTALSLPWRRVRHRAIWATKPAGNHPAKMASSALGSREERRKNCCSSLILKAILEQSLLPFPLKCVFIRDFGSKEE